MKKNLFIILNIFLILTGCKKESNKSIGSIYLVSQVIEEVQLLHGQLVKRDTIEYHYDKNNHLTDYGYIYNGIYSANFKYTYDESNRIIKLEVVDQRSVYEYGYISNYINLSYYWIGDSTKKREKFTLNEKKQIVKIDKDGGYYLTYNYDSKGNVITESFYQPDGSYNKYSSATYSYDSFNNPFGAIKGNYAFMYFNELLPNTCQNNYIGNGSGKTILKYNNDGYLTASTYYETPEDFQFNNNATITYYNYTVK